MEAYCVKCKSKTEIQNPQSITMKNGRPRDPGHLPGLQHEGLPHRRRRQLE